MAQRRESASMATPHPPQINGFLNINKSRGGTSMDVVRRIKRLTGQKRRVGHGGTLDPQAEGVLPGRRHHHLPLQRVAHD